MARSVTICPFSSIVQCQSFSSQRQKILLRRKPLVFLLLHLILLLPADDVDWESSSISFDSNHSRQTCKHNWKWYHKVIKTLVSRGKMRRLPWYFFEKASPHGTYIAFHCQNDIQEFFCRNWHSTSEICTAGLRIIGAFTAFSFLLSLPKVLMTFWSLILLGDCNFQRKSASGDEFFYIMNRRRG